ncbi:MAG: ketopantoate reductase family protein [Phycisphaerales bacterium JB065]
MRTLVVGIGALGGVIGARLISAGAPVSLAVRSRDSASALNERGLTVRGIGGDCSVPVSSVAPLADYHGTERFDLILLATKAQDAIGIAPGLMDLLSAHGTLLPIQNGGVSRVLADRLGARVLGGLSNLGATMLGPGVYEQRNQGHLLIGELNACESERADEIGAWLGQGVDTRVTARMPGAIWSKLLLNCSVTTIGAIAGCPMRGYITLPAGRALFDLVYDEALEVARAEGVEPTRMIVDPIPARSAADGSDDARSRWIDEILEAYGDLVPSMLQDFQRGKPTEIDFINGHVVDRGRQHSVATPANGALVEQAKRISSGEREPGVGLLREVLAGLGG